MNYIHFFIAVVTNCHRLSCLKQHRSITLQSCRSAVPHESHWAEIKPLEGLYSFMGALEGSPLSCLFQLLEDTSVPGLLHLSPKPAEVRLFDCSSVVIAPSLTTARKDSLLLRIHVIRLGPTG